MNINIIEQLRETGATPAYVFDIEVLVKRLNYIRESLSSDSGIELCYAMKANPFLVAELNNCIDAFEVCSPGELEICKSQKVDMDKIVLSGVNKQQAEVIDALESGVQLFTIESMRQLELINTCTENTGKKVDVLLRVTSGNQFGLSKKEAADIIKNRSAYKGLNIEGIQYYSGTQKKAKSIKNEIDELCTYVETIVEDGFDIKKFEYGPGWNVDYFAKAFDEDDMLKQCADSFKKIMKKCKLVLEIGRFLAADCGYYITGVVDVKQRDEATYAIVDGGINHVNYYGQVMGVRVPPVRLFRNNISGLTEECINRESKENGVCICGSLCTSADVLIKYLPVQNINVGDILVFEKIGAYSVTEGIYMFLSRKMPKIYLLKEKQLILCRDSFETYKLNNAFMSMYN